MNVKLAISGIVILSVYALLAWLSTRVKKEPSDVAINLGLVILGGAIGWVVGIFLTPYSAGQKAEFAEYASVIALFASGYLVGKVDAAISHMLKPENLFTPIVGFRLVITFSSFLLGMLVTVVIRYYA
ncbi:hypothetical protein LOH54_06220 [Sulfurimonas sp. HSL-3221]|uniref:DUF340 domain-containing protein n=1 Tax=Sulfurimonas diazotrophicus TaxID=3131939 RepID=A0ABZ3HEH8_9BACT|nr:hypothetical protein [Sulfurimonas sp. HSL-3221]UFS63726.1 hypothetical protein LOH54_06220 [Sulfurimonas sp. HSL-3221]